MLLVLSMEALSRGRSADKRFNERFEFRAAAKRCSPTSRSHVARTAGFARGRAKVLPVLPPSGANGTIFREAAIGKPVSEGLRVFCDCGERRQERERRAASMAQGPVIVIGAGVSGRYTSTTNYPSRVFSSPPAGV